MRTLKNKVVMVGIGETEVGRSVGKSGIQLHVEAAKAAIEDAGLTKDDIEAVLTTVDHVDTYFSIGSILAEYMGITPKYATAIPRGGLSVGSLVYQAAAMINAGMVTTALVVSASNYSSHFMREGFSHMSTSQEYFYNQFEQPYGLVVPSVIAMIANRHMHEFGTTMEQFAAVAVAMRKHGALNPKAQVREPITIQDVLNSRMIAHPLHLLDCSLISDGGGACVLTTVEMARNLRKPPVYLLGAAEGRTYMHFWQAPSFTHFGLIESGKRAFEMAGVKHEDIDVAELYDPFTPIVIVSLENLGFCEIGEGGPFVEAGRIEIGGELPVNTHGGLISFCHSVRPGGIFHVTEAVRQLRGEAEPERQVKGCKIALVNTIGGILSSHCTMIFGR